MPYDIQLYQRKEIQPSQAGEAMPPYSLADESGKIQFGKTLAGFAGQEFQKLLEAKSSNEIHQYIGQINSAREQFNTYVKANPGASIEDIGAARDKMMAGIATFDKSITTQPAKDFAKNYLLENKQVIINKANDVAVARMSEFEFQRMTMQLDNYVKTGNVAGINDLIDRHTGTQIHKDNAQFIKEQYVRKATMTNVLAQAENSPSKDEALKVINSNTMFDDKEKDQLEAEVNAHFNRLKFNTKSQFGKMDVDISNALWPAPDDKGATPPPNADIALKIVNSADLSSLPDDEKETAVKWKKEWNETIEKLAKGQKIASDTDTHNNIIDRIKLMEDDSESGDVRDLIKDSQRTGKLSNTDVKHLNEMLDTKISTEHQKIENSLIDLFPAKSEKRPDFAFALHKMAAEHKDWDCAKLYSEGKSLASTYNKAEQSDIDIAKNKDLSVWQGLSNDAKKKEILGLASLPDKAVRDFEPSATATGIFPPYNVIKYLKAKFGSAVYDTKLNWTKADVEKAKELKDDPDVVEKFTKYLSENSELRYGQKGSSEIPAITSKGEFDKLPVGSFYFNKGQKMQKVK